MSNLRIVGDNAIDRAQLSASSTAGALAPSNLQTDKKSSVWRANGKTERITATWGVTETLQAVVLPFCNLSPTATMRVRVTNEAVVMNLLSAATDFSNGYWTKTGMTLGSAVAGPDGTLSALTLTAAGANATISQNVTVAAGNYTSSFYIRRRTGSGTVSIRNAANTAWTPVAVGANWARIVNDGGVTSTTATAQVQIATSGDAIDLVFPQLEAGSTATSYYPGTRPLGYIDSWQSYNYDSGAVLACPAATKVLRGWTAAQSASAYAYGGGARACVWLPAPYAAYGLAVDIVDANNAQGYIEAARLIAGPYWSPTYNTATLSETNVDGAIHYRTDAGDLLSDASTIHKRLPLSFEFMPAEDRAALADILRASRAYPVFVSVFPGNADSSLERAFSIYGKRMTDSDVEVQAAINYGAKIELESV